MILCLTHSRDFYTIDIVQQYLQHAGYASLRFNSDEFAVQGQFNYSLSNDITESRLIIEGQPIFLSQITAVWYRKLWEIKVPDDLDQSYRDTYIKEYSTYRQIFFDQLQHVPWMNDMNTDHTICHDKLRQLSTAKKFGLTIPKTIMTNEPGLVNDFFEQCNGSMIAKLHGALSRSMEGNMPSFPTTKLSRNDLQLLEGLSYCPMIFQEYIPKAYELRIVYVDGDFFTGKIQHDHKEVTDWRTIKGGTLHWQRYELPTTVQEKVSLLMNNLGLRFGALDMIRHSNGEYVFLEVNPQGEWGMLQRDLAYPIGETIAQKLINRIKNDN